MTNEYCLQYVILIILCDILIGIPLPKKVEKRPRPGEEDEEEQPPPMVT